MGWDVDELETGGAGEVSSNCAIGCSLPRSKSLKSSFLSPETKCPFASRTVTFTTTSLDSIFNCAEGWSDTGEEASGAGAPLPAV